MVKKEKKDILSFHKTIKYPFILFFMLDKFRLKFRELFSSCCCCCKSVVRMKLTSSKMIPFKPSSIIHHTSQQPSPISMTNSTRYNLHNKNKRNTSNSLNISTGSGQTLANTNTNSNNMTRHGGINAYNHNGPITFRLTNV